MKKVLIILCLTLCSLVSGAKELVVIKSKLLKQNDSILVFSPSGADGRTPNLFLLHGYSGNYGNWNKHVDLQAFAEKTGWRIICPDGFYDSWYVNSKDMRWRDFFWEELWPEFESEYRFDPARTFIAGLSMGGHGAINIFLDHPEKFCAAGSMSGALDLDSNLKLIRDLAVKLEDGEDFAKTKAEAAVTRMALADTSLLKNKHIIISCGVSDGLLKASKALEEVCFNRGIPYVAIYGPGKHDWKFWPWSLKYFVEMFSEFMELT